MRLEIMYLIYMYKEDLEFQWLIYHKTKPNLNLLWSHLWIK